MVATLISQQSPKPSRRSPPTINFLISLRAADPNHGAPPADTAVIQECAPHCERIIVFSASGAGAGDVAASLCFSEWQHTLRSVTRLWERRLRGDHDFIPDIILSYAPPVPSDTDELRREMGAVFAGQLYGGEFESSAAEIPAKMTEEFNAAMACVLKYIVGRDPLVEEVAAQGRDFVRLGMEPRLCKLILHCHRRGLGKEGLVLAAVMSNSGTVFFRAGSEADRLKADRLKVRFCHPGGDLFTMLSVFKEWEALPRDRRGQWCWSNSINGKSMWRCEQAIGEMERCLRRELGVIVPRHYGHGDENEEQLKMAILSAFVDNVAMYSGHDRVGYRVAATGRTVPLHPSCSLQMFAEKPTWVVFGQLLSTGSKDYLACVTSFEFESLHTLDPPPSFDFERMDREKILVKRMTGLGSVLMRNLADDKDDCNLQSIVEMCDRSCSNSEQRSGIELDFDRNEILLFATAEKMEDLYHLVEEAVVIERRALHNECIEKHIFQDGSGFVSSSVALVGSGAQIKQLLFRPFAPQAITATVDWPRIRSKGKATVTCYNANDVEVLLNDFHLLLSSPGYGYVFVSRNTKEQNSISLSHIDKQLHDNEVLQVVRNAASREIKGFKLHREDDAALPDPAPGDSEEALRREISPFMPNQNSSFEVRVFRPRPKEVYTRASITFDGRFHSEADRALEHLDGQTLVGCRSWQRIKCRRRFSTSLTCCGSIYSAIRQPLDSLLTSFRNQDGVEISVEKDGQDSIRVQLFAGATETLVELRRAVEEVMRGRVITQDSLPETILQHLFSPGGMDLMRRVQLKTETYILFDRHHLEVRIFGSPSNSASAEKRLVESLLQLSSQIHLKGGGLPPDLMKKVVEKFGPDLKGLKAKFQEAEFVLDTQRHVISVRGCSEVKQRAEEAVREVAEASGGHTHNNSCPICLCEVENGYRLESCSHLSCRLCLAEQFKSAVMNQDSFPVCCAMEGCGMPILVADLRLLLSREKLEELFRASLKSYVASSGGAFRFCPSPDCPSVYQVADDPGTLMESEPFVCEVCSAETCTICHLEYHPTVTCDRYREYKEDPDLSLRDWCKGKAHVKNCPSCFLIIEKFDGCNHMQCRCGRHVCWLCLEHFSSSRECYAHLHSMHP